MTITTAQLKKLFPTASAALVAAVVAGWPAAQAAGIGDTRERTALFLANIGVETGGLKLVAENLNYTSAARIRAVWPTRFKSDAAAKPFVRQPQKLANKVYNGRMGNRAGSNDGFEYRGGGMMQTTGREGYKALGFEASPEELRKPDVAFATAVREWDRRGCNAAADAGDIETCRRKINGGTHGLAEVRRYYRKALDIFYVAKPETVAFAAVEPDFDDDLTEKVQALLRERGYPEVGRVDGKLGDRTANAIRSFQADNHMDLTGSVSDELLAALVKAPQRDNGPRATATEADLSDAPSIVQGQTLSKGGIGAAVVAVAGSVVNGTISADELVGHISAGKMLWAAAGSFAPWIALGVGGILAWKYGRRFVREQVEAYREGRHV